MELLYYSSYFGFVLVFTSLYYSFIFYAIIFLAGTLSSLNYWKDPTSNINRYIDIICIWSIGLYFTYLAYIYSIYTYLYYIILETILYTLELIIDNYSNDIDGCIIESGFATEFSFLKLMQIEPTDINFKLGDGFMNLEKLKTYKKPLFIIHADLDDIIPFSQAEMILIESPSKIKNIFKVNGANHNNIIMIAREEYFIKIKSFIDSV